MSKTSVKRHFSAISLKAGLPEPGFIQQPHPIQLTENPRASKKQRQPSSSSGMRSTESKSPQHNPFVAQSKFEFDVKPKSKSCQDKIYSTEDVEAIVKKREEQLKEEFQAILNSLLQEQFESFTRFNRDSISRQMQRNDYSSSYFS